MRTRLSHVAISVPIGTLTDQYRADLLEFYGTLLGWTEIESLRLPDRLILRLDQEHYINLRERASPMVCSGYEHFGVVVPSAADAEALWDRLDREPRDVHLEPLDTNDHGVSSFRFRYLLPLTVEVQFFPRLAEHTSSGA